MATTTRVALVTGGMGGLGEAICLKLAALGDKVVTTFSPGNKKAQEWLDTMREQPAPGLPQAERDSLLARARDVIEHIQRVLSDCDGNISQAAKRLGLRRRSLQRKLSKYPPPR